MSYVGTKMFFGVCLNMYVTILLINNQNVWLNKRLIEERGLIIAGLKYGDTKVNKNKTKNTLSGIFCFVFIYFCFFLFFGNNNNNNNNMI